MKLGIQTIKGKTYVNIGLCHLYVGEGAKGITNAFNTCRKLINQGFEEVFGNV